MIASNYGYTGREKDLETGLDYYRNRYYDSKVRRFISKDPLGFVDGPNDYAYVVNNSINWIDPLGLYGTNSCDYYDKRCQESGGKYYCEQAPYWCDWFPKRPDPNPNRDDDYEGWSRCTRQCLQDCDAYENKNQNSCPIIPDNRKGPWDPRSQSFDCHVKCYNTCALDNPTKNPF